MSEIFYTSNFKLVSRFRRKTKVHPQIDSQKSSSSNDVPFVSSHKKDSYDYLLDLCCSVYPKELHTVLQALPGWRLSMHSFLVLLIKNFVCTWYGEKIPTTETEFLVLLFEFFERFVDKLCAHSLPIKKILGDDIPWILDTHITIMKKVLEENLTLNDFYSLYLYKNQYPKVIGEPILQTMLCDSQLETAFLRSFLNDFILDKLMDKIAEPFVILEVVKVLCERLLKEDKNDRIENELPRKTKKASFIEIGSHIFTVVIERIKLFVGIPSAKTKIANLFIFKLIANSTKISSRKPLLYHFCKTVQLLSIRIPIINSASALFLDGFVRSLKVENMSIIFDKARHLLFPNDNKIGRSRPVPSPEEITELKAICAELLYKVCIRNHLDVILGTTKSDCLHLINGVTKDRNMNKFILQRILDYLVNGYPLYE